MWILLGHRPSFWICLITRWHSHLSISPSQGLVTSSQVGCTCDIFSRFLQDKKAAEAQMLQPRHIHLSFTYHLPEFTYESPEFNQWIEHDGTQLVPQTMNALLLLQYIIFGTAGLEIKLATHTNDGGNKLWVGQIPLGTSKDTIFVGGGVMCRRSFRDHPGLVKWVDGLQDVLWHEFTKFGPVWVAVMAGVGWRAWQVACCRRNPWEIFSDSPVQMRNMWVGWRWWRRRRWWWWWRWRWRRWRRRRWIIIIMIIIIILIILLLLLLIRRRRRRIRRKPTRKITRSRFLFYGNQKE